MGNSQQSYAIGTGRTQGDTDIGDARTFKFKDRINVKFGQGKPSGYAANALYNVVEGTSGDYNYKQETVNADGSVTVHYYKITLNAANTGTSSNISWTEVSSAGTDTIQIKLPNNQVKYLKYTYTSPSGYIAAGSRLTSIASADVTNKVFSGKSLVENYVDTSSVYGGDSSVTGSSGSSDADATNYEDGYNNITRTSKGGAIYNTSNNSSVNITADFKENYVDQRVTAGKGYGGSAYAYGGTASDSGGSGSSNEDASAHADATATAEGSADGTANAYGGAIANTSYLGSVKAVSYTHLVMGM